MPSGSSIKDGLRPIVHRLRHRRDSLLYGSCAVLLYHRVTEIPTDPQQLAVKPVHFDEHLAVLKKNYHLLSITEFDELLLKRKKFPPNAVLLTFDDGYADNHLEARPILERHGLQALFYIATDHIGSGREFWWDELERMFLVNDNLPMDLAFARDRVRINWSAPGAASSVERGSTYENQLNVMRRLPSALREEILGELRVVLNSAVARTTHLPMSVEQLRAFSGSPSVVLGAHTLGHPSLAHLSSNEQQHEIAGSKRALEVLVGMPVKYFSYPFGTGADFNATTEALAREAGFLHVAANYPGMVHARRSPISFPRYLVRDWDGPQFSKEIQRFFRG